MQPQFAFFGTNATNHSELIAVDGTSTPRWFHHGTMEHDNEPVLFPLGDTPSIQIKGTTPPQNTQRYWKRNQPSFMLTSCFFWVISIFLFMLIVTFSSEANAASVTLEWDPVSQSIDGYRIYMRTEGQTYDYKNPVWEGTATTCTIDDLKAGNTYYFVARAYKGQEESKNSPEVRFDAPVVFPPTAKANGDQIVLALTAVTLDGTASTDPDDSILIYEWSQTAGTTVSLADRSKAKTSFKAPNVTTVAKLKFQLKVSDSDGLSATDTCQITIYPAGSADSDKDGITNVDEIKVYGTDPSNPDTDGDGVGDGEEIKAGTDPNKGPDVKIWIEAEDGDISYPMQISGNQTASAKGFIEVEETSLDRGGNARYTFEVQYSGEYVIWGRVIANSLTTDSFFVSIDNGPDLTWHTMLGGQDTWAWDIISQRLVSDPRDTSKPFVYSFTTGTHTLTIKQRENGTRLDKILITNDKSFSPQGTGDQTEEVIDKIWLEAEDGTLNVPMQTESDSKASSGKYITVPSGNGNTTDPSLQAGQAKYTFNVSNSGNYIIWGRLIASNGTNDSFYVSLDDNDFMVWHTKTDKQENWIWDVISQRRFGEIRDNSNPWFYYLEKGSHTLTIKHRESGAKLDKILITNDMTFSPESQEDSQPITALKIYMEAEDGVLNAPMQAENDPNASAGKYIVVPKGNDKLSDPSLKGGDVVFTFDVQNPGDFVIWGRVSAEDGTSDSFYVSVDGKELLEWHTIKDGQENWIWDVVSQRTLGEKRNTSNPFLYHLEAGPHTLNIKYRESGTKLDRILITDDNDIEL